MRGASDVGQLDLAKVLLEVLSQGVWRPGQLRAAGDVAELGVRKASVAAGVLLLECCCRVCKGRWQLGAAGNVEELVVSR